MPGPSQLHLVKHNAPVICLFARRLVYFKLQEWRLPNMSEEMLNEAKVEVIKFDEGKQGDNS